MSTRHLLARRGRRQVTAIATDTMDAATGEGDVFSGPASLQRARSCVELTHHSSQAMASSTSVDLEAPVVRSTVGVAQPEPRTQPSIARTLFFAICTGSLIIIASLVVVVFWYGVLAEPEEILRKAARIGGGVMGAIAAAPNAVRTKPPAVISYVGVPQTQLPSGQWNSTNDAIAALPDNSPLGSIIGSYAQREVLYNGSDDSQLPPAL